MPMLPIVTYHAIGDVSSPLWTTPACLEAQLRAMADAGYRSLTVGELVASLGEGRLPERSLVLTFDDGFASVVDQALPRLRAHGFRATVFLITGRCGGDNGWPGQPSSVPRAPLMTWADAEALAAAGWEIGAHGVTHRPLVGLPAAAVDNEVAASCRAIAERLGRPPRSFAFPYGAHDAAAVAAVRRHVAGAVGTRLGLVAPRSDRFVLPRIDAWYVKPENVARIAGRAARLRFAVRQVARSARRAIRPDWRPTEVDAADG